MTKRSQHAQYPDDSEASFQVLSAPYALDEADSPQVQYERYTKDPDRHMEIDGATYYKIISAYTIRLHGQQFIIAVVENSMNGRIGDILTDEDGREFPVAAIETLHECCPRTTYLALKADSMEIGKYLTVKPLSSSPEMC